MKKIFVLFACIYSTLTYSQLKNYNCENAVEINSPTTISGVIKFQEISNINFPEYDYTQYFYGHWYKINGDDRFHRIEVSNTSDYYILEGDCNQNKTSHAKAILAEKDKSYFIVVYKPTTMLNDLSYTLKISNEEPPISYLCREATTMNCGDEKTLVLKDYIDNLEYQSCKIEDVSGAFDKIAWIKIKGDGKIKTIRSNFSNITKLYLKKCDEENCNFKIIADKLSYFSFLTEAEEDYIVGLNSYYDNQLIINLSCSEPSENTFCDDAIPIECGIDTIISSVPNYYYSMNLQSCNYISDSYSDKWFSLPKMKAYYKLDINSISENTNFQVTLVSSKEGNCKDANCKETAVLNTSANSYVFKTEDDDQFYLLKRSQESSFGMKLSCISESEYKNYRASCYDRAIMPSCGDTLKVKKTSGYSSFCGSNTGFDFYIKLHGQNVKHKFKNIDNIPISAYIFKKDSKNNFNGVGENLNGDNKSFNVTTLDDDTIYVGIHLIDNKECRLQHNCANFQELQNSMNPIACNESMILDTIVPEVYISLDKNPFLSRFFKFESKSSEVTIKGGNGNNIYLYELKDGAPQLIKTSTNELQFISKDKPYLIAVNYTSYNKSKNINVKCIPLRDTSYENAPILSCDEPYTVLESLENIYIGDTKSELIGSVYQLLGDDKLHTLSAIDQLEFQVFEYSETDKNYVQLKIGISEKWFAKKESKYLIIAGNEFGFAEGYEFRLTCEDLYSNIQCALATDLLCGDEKLVDLTITPGIKINDQVNRSYGPLWYKITGNDEMINIERTNGSFFNLTMYEGSCNDTIKLASTDLNRLSFYGETGKEYLLKFLFNPGVNSSFEVSCGKAELGQLCSEAKEIACGENALYEYKKTSAVKISSEDGSQHYFKAANWYKFIGTGNIVKFSYGDLSRISVGIATGTCENLILKPDDLKNYSFMGELGVNYYIILSSNHQLLTNIKIKIQCFGSHTPSSCAAPLPLPCNEEFIFNNTFDSNATFGNCSDTFKGKWYEIQGGNKFVTIKSNIYTPLNFMVGNGDCKNMECVESFTLSNDKKTQLFELKESKPYYIFIASKELTEGFLTIVCNNPNENDNCEKAKALQCNQAIEVNANFSLSSTAFCSDTSKGEYFTFIGDGMYHRFHYDFDASAVTTPMNFWLKKGNCTNDNCVVQKHDLLRADYQFFAEKDSLYTIKISSTNKLIQKINVSCFDELSNGKCETAQAVKCNEKINFYFNSISSSFACNFNLYNPNWYILPNENAYYAIEIDSMQDEQMVLTQYFGDCNNLNCRSIFINKSDKKFTPIIKGKANEESYFSLSNYNNNKSFGSFHLRCTTSVTNDECIKAEDINCGKVIIDKLGDGALFLDNYNSCGKNKFYKLQNNKLINKISYDKISDFEGTISVIAYENDCLQYTSIETLQAGKTNHLEFTFEMKENLKYLLVVSGLNDLDSFKINFDCVSETDELATQQSTNAIKVMPNPFINNTTISFFHPSNERNAIVKVYDVVGKVVFDGKHDLIEGENNIQIDSKYLNGPGMYRVELLTKGRKLRGVIVSIE